MEIIYLFILQLIAHLFTDFFFISNKNKKNEYNLGFKNAFLKWHFLIAFSLSWMLSFQINFIYGALLIAAMHYLLGGSKKYLSNHPALSKYSFFIIQSLHLIILILVVFIFQRYQNIIPAFDLNENLKYLLIFTGYLISLKPANIFIKQIFIAFDIGVVENEDLPNAGKLIGILERFLVLTFILSNQFEAVGFLIAAKSILRYKGNNTLKTEYVLIGTMLSFGIAVVLGVIINLI